MIDLADRRVKRRAGVGEFERRQVFDVRTVGVVAIAGLREGCDKGVDRAAGIGGRELIGIGEIQGSHEAIGADARLIGKIIEKQQSLHAAISPDFEAGAVGRKRVGTDGPDAVGIGAHAGMVAVIETEREHPVRRRGRRARGAKIDEIRGAVAVEDLAKVSLRGARFRRSIGFMRGSRCDAAPVFVGVEKNGRVAMVVECLADAPFEYAGRVLRIGYPALGRVAVDRNDVVASDRTPMDDPGRARAPAFDTREQALDARAIIGDLIVDAKHLAGDAHARTRCVEQRRQVFSARDQVDVGLAQIVVSRQTLVCLSAQHGSVESPAETEDAVSRSRNRSSN